MLTRRTFLKSLTGATAFGAGLSSYAFGIEPGYRLTVREWTVASAAWSAAIKPLRIAVLSDIHAFEPYMSAARIARIVETANALEPDLIVLPGDFVATNSQYFMVRRVPIPDWAGALSALRAPLGVYAVLGNHDWWLNAGAVQLGLQNAGITVLENRAVKIVRGADSFWLAGLGDQLAHYAGGGRFRGADDLDGMLAQVTDSAPVIMLAHEPDIFVRTPARVALTLAGHTHGGQVWLPFLGPPITGTKLGRRYVYGHVEDAGRHLVVSAGLGVSWFPVRFNIPPEITVVNLHGAGAPAVT